MGAFIFSILQNILFLLEIAIFANAAVSWLVAFDVINLRNPTANTVVRMLDNVVRPVLWPFRRIIPVLGGVDISPIFALIVIEAARKYLLPWMFGLLPAALG